MHSTQVRFCLTFKTLSFISSATPNLSCPPLDGTSLPLADLYTCLVPPTHLSSLSSATAASHQGSISQQDHPVLGVPYFYVHPCETAVLMNAVRPGEGGNVGEEGYLRAWLSLVGGAVGVRVKLGYFVGDSNKVLAV